jgi:SAM-dependent methyltransferase
MRSDIPKNWDNYKAVLTIAQRHPNKDAVFLDAGGVTASTFLPSMRKLGYKRLVALDLTNPQPPRNDGDILYARGDITATPYLDSHFDAVACISVIEHGVPLETFFKEMSRILKQNGTLIVSTDYWDEKIVNTDGRMAYGVPVHIFSEQEIRDMIKIAEKCGFELLQPTDVDYKCEERTINWMGFSYTFIFLGFQKK